MTKTGIGLAIVLAIFVVFLAYCTRETSHPSSEPGNSNASPFATEPETTSIRDSTSTDLVPEKHEGYVNMPRDPDRVATNGQPAIEIENSDSTADVNQHRNGHINEPDRNRTNLQKVENEKDPESYRFVKLDANGQRMTDSADNWSCILDSTTNLIWEAKQGAPGIGYKNDRFGWFGEHAADEGYFTGFEYKDEESCSIREIYTEVVGDAEFGCNTQAYATLINAVALCGFRNWRVPTVEELLSIVHESKKDPSVDVTYFPNTLSDYYWSDAPYAYEDRNSVAVSFRVGFANDQKKRTLLPVRLVASGPSSDSATMRSQPYP